MTTFQEAVKKVVEENFAAGYKAAIKNELTEMEKLVLALVATGAQTYFEGSKNKKTKKRQMTDAGRDLSYAGYMTFKIRGNGYEAEITDAGKEMFDAIPTEELVGLIGQSEAQRNRQSSSNRINGRYAEVDTCDYCLKKKTDVYADDEGDRDIICADCSRKRDAGEEIG